MGTVDKQETVTTQELFISSPLVDQPFQLMSSGRAGWFSFLYTNSTWSSIFKVRSVRERVSFFILIVKSFRVFKSSSFCLCIFARIPSTTTNPIASAIMTRFSIERLALSDNYLGKRYARL